MATTNDPVAQAVAAERSRTSTIHRLGAAHGVPAAKVAKATRDGMTADAFALEIADDALKARAVAEVDETARRIAGVS